jgi:hypothetical protein
MPSLPPQDGIDTQICTGIRTGPSTISAVNRLTHVVSTSLPLPPTGEHDAIATPAAHSSCHLVPFMSMGGGSPQTRLHSCLQGLMAPSPMSFGVSTPSHSPHYFVPFMSMGGECTPAAGPLQLPTGATRYSCQGLMVPSPVTSGATRPSSSSACPFLPTWSSPTHPLPMMGGSAALAACHALEHSHQRLASTMSKCPGFADANPWVMETINAVTLELQCWYRRHSIC